MAGVPEGRERSDDGVLKADMLFCCAGGRSTLALCRLSGTAPILRHAEVSYGCRLSGRKRKSFGHCQTVAIDPTETLLDRLGPVDFDGDDGFLRRQRQRSAAANETERRTNRLVL